MTIEENIDAILLAEGVKLTNIKGDRGGLTHYGITKVGYSDYLGRPATDQDIANLDLSKARIFYGWLWDKSCIGLITDAKVQSFVFDWIVNRGRFGATGEIQRLLGVHPEDEILGPQTAAYINQSSNVLPRMIRRRMHLFIVQSISQVPKNIIESTDLKMLDGWWNRVAEFL
jgi:lysozyme family protein